MKVILEIFRYIFSALLAIAILAVYMCNIALSTVLSEGYVISKFSQTNYYKKISENLNENFSKYILQSGLDENIINEICSKDKIEQDTNYIIENIYFGKNNEIETETIRNNLNNNINTFLNGQEITPESRKSIDEFVEIICNEYINTIFHTTYEQKANTYIKKAESYLNLLNKYAKYALIIIVILIFIIDIKKPARNISIVGMSFLLLGIILIYGKNVIIKNFDYNHIYILSEAFSDVLKLILDENFALLIVNAKRFIILGIILIIVGNIFQIKIKKKHRNKKIKLLPKYTQK